MRRFAASVWLGCALLATRPVLAQAQGEQVPPTASVPATVAPAIDPVAFASFIEGIRQEALAKGVSTATVEHALASVEPQPSVLERDRQQAEFTLDLKAYLKRRLTKDTLRQARTLWHKHRALASRVGKAYGVDPHLLIAVWGLESNFGRFSGVRASIPTLATLAFDGRRAALFRTELLDALTIVEHGDIALEHMKGSWAGALGQVQFLPSSYLAFAVDFDQDGRRDIWTSLPDVLASIGNYLKGHGWTPGVAWGYPVSVPDAAAPAVGAVPLRNEGCRAIRELTTSKPVSDWIALGVTPDKGGVQPKRATVASLLRVDDRAWLVTANYEALVAYNCAHNYAISVAMLAAKIAK